MGQPLLIPESPLQLLPSLAAEIGVNEAIVLQQVHYWSLHKLSRDEGPWVYNTQDDWLLQFPWLTLRTLQRVLERLQKIELLQTQQPEGTNRRTHYRIAYDKLPCSEAANMASSSRHIGGLSIHNSKTTQREQARNSPPSPTQPVVRSPLTVQIEAVWSKYVAVMKPRGRGVDLQPDDRAIIRSALKAGDVAELEAAIATCGASDFHMKRGAYKTRKGGKFKSIGQIFKPRPTKGESWRSRLEWWLDLAEEADEGAVEFDVNAEAERMRREQGLS